MIQIIDNLDHRSKKPNFVRDLFDTLQAMRSFPESDIDEGHISYCIETNKHYKFNYENLADESTGKWREFKGEKGDPGQPGKDGSSLSSYFTAFIFRSSEIEPGTPTGGSWDPSTNVVTPPTGWALKDSDLSGTIWMSWGVFTPLGTIRDAWSTPIRLTGEDGRNGTDGKSVEFIYKLANREPTPDDRPGSVNIDDYVPSGWTDNPTGISLTVLYEWMCMRVNTGGFWSDWHGPTIWSRWGFDGRDGDGVEFIYRRTITSTAPDRPTEIVQEDEYVPTNWTDNPTGVDSGHMYEWVSIRKFKDSQWGPFGKVALWAKWGEKGEPGKDGSDGTSINIKGTVDSVSDLPSSAQPGDAYVVGDYLYVWDGLRWLNVGAMKGPAGDSAYVHIAFADGVTTNSQGVVTNVYGFTTSGSTNKAWFGTCADHNVADPTDPLVYKWQHNKGEKGDKGDLGPQGVPGPAGEGGVTLYTWIRYADDIQGNGISNNPDGKKYIGLGYNKTTYVESNDPADYIWTAIDDTGGAPSGGGLYTWIKYADAIPKTDTDVIYDIPNDGTMYIGIAVNQETKVESTNGLLYTWSLFRGKDGSNGRIIYPAGIYDATVTYTATDVKAPYVVHGDNYYVMNKTTSWLGTSTGKTPLENYDEFGSLATWIPMEKFNAVYTNILLADYGKVGKFVFYGDYMYSQLGVDNYGYDTEHYERFSNPSIPFKFSDTSKWKEVFAAVMGYQLDIQDNKVTLPNLNFISSTLTRVFGLIDTNYLEQFSFRVSGLRSDNVLVFKYYYSGNLEYNLTITSDGTYSVPALNDLTIGDNSGFYLSVASRGSESITISLLENSFTPNFSVNAVTGKVRLTKGEFLTRINENFEVFDVSRHSDLDINPEINTQYVVENNLGESSSECILPKPTSKYSGAFIIISCTDSGALQENKYTTVAVRIDGATISSNNLVWKNRRDIYSISLDPGDVLKLRCIPRKGVMTSINIKGIYYDWVVDNPMDFKLWGIDPDNSNTLCAAWR